jgi:hypothetical protein
MRVFMLAALLGLLLTPASAQLLNITTVTLPTGQVGQSYNATVQTSGGTPPITFSISSGSPPPGILISAGSGILYGTPTTAGTFNFVVRAQDSTMATTQEDFQPFTIVISPSASLSVQPASLPTVPAGAPFSIQLSATGGISPYFFEFEFFPAQPPEWLNLSFSGLLTGTPPSAGSYPFSVYVMDQGSSSILKTYTLNVGPTVAFITATLPNATAGQPYSATFVASGGQTPYTFSVVSGTLPAGLVLNPSGMLSGTPTSPSYATFTVQVTDALSSHASRSFTLDVQPPAMNFTPATLPSGTSGTPYSASFTPTGAGSSYSFSILDASPPPGLSLASNGVLSGTPTSAGTFNFTVRLSAGSSNVDKQVTVTILAPTISISTSTLPDAMQGQAYQASLTASGGTPPYSFSVAEGNLPPGVSLGSGGVFSGAPSVSGSYSFAVAVTGSAGDQASRVLSILVLAPLALEPESLPPGKMGEPYSVQLQPSGGRTPYIFSLSGDLPEGIGFSGGVFSGTPSRPGAATVVVTLRDADGRTVERSYRLVVPSNIEISTTGPLPQGAVGQDYSTTFAATGGIPPYQWTTVGGLPPGLLLNPSTGDLSGKPTSAGEFSFSVRVQDETESSAVKTFTVKTVLPPLPPIVFTQIGSTAPPAQQPTFGLRINQPYPIPVTGVVTLTFAPDRFGDDPAVLFSNGSRTMPFTIPAGQQDATFGSATGALQTGTVAGTITLTSRLSIDGADVTPSPAPQQTVLIAPSAPVITKLELNRVSGGFELVVTGYSTPRQLTQAVVKITPTSGSALATSEFPIALESVFSSYYGGTASAPYGSQFRLVIPFYVPQGLTGLASASVTLTNSVGTSTAASVNF